MENVSATSPLVIGCALVLSVSITQAQTIVIDDFELDEGHFISTPSGSGSTHGETETVPGWVLRRRIAWAVRRLKPSLAPIPSGSS